MYSEMKMQFILKCCITCIVKRQRWEELCTVGNAFVNDVKFLREKENFVSTVPYVHTKPPTSLEFATYKDPSKLFKEPAIIGIRDNFKKFSPITNEEVLENMFYWCKEHSESTDEEHKRFLTILGPRLIQALSSISCSISKSW